MMQAVFFTEKRMKVLLFLDTEFKIGMFYNFLPGTFIH